MDGPPAGLSCGGQRVTVEKVKSARVRLQQRANATCGVFLQAHIKSQLVRQ